jgi:predicted nucleotidyltransferase
MDVETVLREKKNEILRVAEKHGAHNVRIFGSVARGQADDQSDIDLLVSMDPGRSLLDHAALWLEMQQLLGQEVDVVSERGLKPRIREHVLRESRLL